MRKSRSLSRGQRFGLGMSQGGADPITDIATAGLIDGTGWLVGRLRDRLLRRQKPKDPLRLPLAEGESTGTGNVRIMGARDD